MDEDEEYIRVEWDGGETLEEELASNAAQWKEVNRVLSTHPGWRAYDCDDGSCAIICAPAGTSGVGQPID